MLSEEKDRYEEDESEQEEGPPKTIPFIAYVEGSHFGDVDIFFKEGSFIRDSTAVTICESHFFVL